MGTIEGEGAALLFLIQHPGFGQGGLDAAERRLVGAADGVQVHPAGHAGEQAGRRRFGLPDKGVGVVTLIKELGLVPSNSEGFRTIEQGGLSIGGRKVTDKKLAVTLDMFEDGKLLIQKGKKKFHMIEL